MNKWIKVFVVLTILFLSYWREIIFLQINATLKAEPWNYANTPTPEFILQLTASELIRLKWGLTIIFSCFISGLTIWLCKQLTSLTWLKRLIMAVYGIILLGILTLGLSLFFSADTELFYGPLRKLIGLLQGPILLLVLGIITYTANTLSKLQNPKI